MFFLLVHPQMYLGKSFKAAQNKRKFKLRSKWPPKRVPILPPSPKFLTRLIHALFACASSDVSQKELQSSTQQKKVQSDIKSAKVVPKKSTYSASYSQISNEGNSGVYLGTTLVPNLDDFLGGKLEKGFSPLCIFKLLLKWP